MGDQAVRVGERGWGLYFVFVVVCLFVWSCVRAFQRFAFLFQRFSFVRSAFLAFCISAF